MHPSDRSPRIEADHQTSNTHKHIPMRMCVICRQRFPKSEIIRYTCPHADEKTLWADPAGKRPGRGFYVCTSSECM